MAEDAPGTRAVLVGIHGREAAAAAGLGAELDQEIARRDPPQLHAVIVQTSAEKRLVGKRCVLEVPRMLVDLVLIADAGKKTATLQGEAAAKRQGLEERLLDLDLVLGGERGDQ